MLKEIKRLSLIELQAIEREVTAWGMTLAGKFTDNANGDMAVYLMEVVIVAKQGGADDWAAYIGTPYGTAQYKDYLALGIDLDNPAYVQTNGDKVYQRLAERLFPDFVAAGLVYRP